jgi:cell wall-associated NlpC family hydrolase
MLASRARTTSRRQASTGISTIDLAIARRQAWNAGRRRQIALSTTPDPAGEFSTTPDADGIARLVAQEENEELIREALEARGTRYRWGGSSRGGFDCSGFTRYLFARYAGVKLPHSARAQSKLGQKVPREALQPGDLLFFRTSRRGISHVGLYIGGNKFVHAANTRRRVRVDSLDTPYYRNRLVTARRLRDPGPQELWGLPPPTTATGTLVEEE